eukprot:gb/GECH01008243.1/.p1 GENE.gb/GECH01008243.1/~~gb/GECH01008243.1/.p1  ORF type:complete len:326 (+),score=68.28 gb/GECH01008243.1/:1-978(+)
MANQNQEVFLHFHTAQFRLHPQLVTKPNIETLCLLNDAVLLKPIPHTRESEVIDPNLDGTFPVVPGHPYIVVPTSYIEHPNSADTMSQEEEEALAESLFVRLQDARRNLISKHFTRGDSDLYHLHPDMLHPFLQSRIEGNTSNQLKKETESGIYSFPAFSETTCDRFIQEIHHIENSGLPVNRPNSMNNYGVVIDDFGFSSFIQDLWIKYLRPMTKKLFPDIVDQIDSHHAFVVQYKMNEDRDLGVHYDSSILTVNICLGSEFQGGELFFQGLNGHPETYDENFMYQHIPGRAVLHLGNHKHGARELESGERYNLIVWFQGTPAQ